MATTIPSAALVPVVPVFSNTERLALAGFLAGYSGLTRQAYELDLLPNTSPIRWAIVTSRRSGIRRGPGWRLQARDGLSGPGTAGRRAGR